MWRKDEWFVELEPDAKLVWIYTFTNEATSPAGIYRSTLRTIANETGIALQRVREIIAEFADAGKLYYEDGIIWPVTMRKHQIGELKATDNLVKRVLADVADLGESPIVARYMEYYGPLPETTKGVQTPSQAPSKGVRLTYTDTYTDTDTETGNNHAPAAPDEDEVAPEPDPLTRAVMNVYDAAGIMMSKTHLDAHLETIKRTGLAAWQDGWSLARAAGKHNVPAYVARCAESAMLKEQQRAAGGNGRNGTGPGPRLTPVQEAARLVMQEISEHASQ